MLGHTHIALGIASALAIVQLTDTASPTSVEFTALLIGSLAPDIDSMNSTIGKPGRIFAKILRKGPRKVLDFLGNAITKTANLVFGHRGFFHWPILALGFIILGLWQNGHWLCWFGFGYMSHILGDFLTPQGAPMFAPLYCRCLSGASIRTGSWMESLISVMLWGYIICRGVEYMPRETSRWLDHCLKIAHIELPAASSPADSE